ncbi:MAG: 3-isopropylmalate dehydratase small subunit [Acidimicrobiales bacterium]|jgi:3-isopropylmalate/(R)-2-methylmalate dehydratase small subunit
MKPVRVIEGRAVPLERSDVDTDQIIPSDWLKRVERTGFGRGLFSEWRDDPSFVLNDQRYVGANILVAGPRFGTGSSREHAVWALMDYGFAAVVAPSFGDIFRNNSSKQGLVIVQLAQEDVDELTRLVKEDSTRLVIVDVDQMRVEVPQVDWHRSFVLDPMIRERLLNGWDDIGLTMHREASITSFEERSTAPTLEGVFDGAGHVIAR